jgi:hypothetical protein
MLSDIEKMIYCMVGNSSTEKDGCLVVNCNEETILSEKTLLEKFLETISNHYGKDYRILEESKSEKEYIFITNLPYEIYQKEIGEYKREFEQQFDSKA